MNRPLEQLPANERKAVQIFVERLLAEFGPDVADVRLFGSKARSDSGSESDLDILVLVKRSDYALKHAILWLASEVSLAYDVLLSPRVIPPAAWQEMAQFETLFYRTVASESVPLA